MGPPPVVTGLSPKEGPPGTKVTIRGENLGTSQQDLVCVLIGEWDCSLTADWHSANKIVILSGTSRGFCDVIITTRSGGTGSCTVKFKGVDQVVGHLKESAVWLKDFDSEREEILQELVSTHNLGQEDVLGISMEGYEVKYPEDELETLFPSRSGSLFSESFHPAWFLLENHHQSGYDDLRAGLSFLRRKVNAEKEGQLSFLKDYAGLVIDQLDALSEMRELFKRHTSDHDPMVTMDQAINASKDEADKLFQDVLRRKDRADSTRSALAVLQRYRFLFYLPVSIERNMRRREFDVIINDYAKARGLFADTEVQVFKQVMAVVETKIANLRDILKTKLKEVNGSFEEQKQIIRYLVSLDTPGDVGWECILSEHAFIRAVLTSCREQYASPGGGGGAATAGAGSGAAVDAQTTAPPIVLFIEDVADRMTGKFPGLFKLGQCYFQGELYSTPESARKPDFKRLVSSVVEVWCALVRGALLPHTADSPELAWSDTLREPVWLQACLREVTATYGSLQLLGVAPEALDEVSQLVFDLRKHCLMTMFRRTMEAVRQLPGRDAWTLEPSLDASGYGCTRLLTQFMTSVTDVVVQAEEQVLTAGPQETPLMQNETVRKDVVVLVYNLVATFAQVLERLAFEDAESEEGSGSEDGAPAVAEAPSVEYRLLVVLSNCHVLRVSRAPQLADVFTSHGFPAAEVQQGLQKVTDVLSDLEQKLFEAYMEEKADPILGIVEMSMYQGRFDWSHVLRPPTDVRGYVKEVIMNCIGVHHEVYSVSPLLVRRVLCNLVEGVAEELSRLMTSVVRMTPAGGQQARLDLAALQETLQLYVTEAARLSFVEASESLPNHQDPAGDKRLVEELLKKFRANMKLQIMCFTKEPSLEDFPSE
ncbi:exocyst complex component 2-like [Pollicipes pollicipes]|uniref:exocyst complex component 2-like n=1 Tax=Pollicipes pollicipes TaxID=41117 RepID=UPI00188500A6|nr:exocyst complex component 2-like [Pollicipes pollicipes]XP_037078503.1 exocyst complex component 2-like [Pollicipes pollicipes]